jgi:hypothetical protein
MFEKLYGSCEDFVCGSDGESAVEKKSSVVLENLRKVVWCWRRRK